MAAREHSRARAALPAAGGEVSRRDLLAGAVAAPTALTLPPLRDGGPSPEMGEGVQAEWEAAVAGLARAEAEIAAFKRAEKAMRGEGGLAASDGLGSADPPAGHCGGTHESTTFTGTHDSSRCSGGAHAPASLLGAAWPEPGGVSYAAQWELDEAFSDLACAQNAALERLLLAPAPDLAALARKLALAVEELAWELPQGEASMAVLVADANRLARR